MLNTPADFPYAGSHGFVRVSLGRPRKPGEAFPAEAVRVLRHNPARPGQPATVFVAITGCRAMAEIASGNRTVPRAHLFATREEAMFPAGLRTREQPKPSRARA